MYLLFTKNASLYTGVVWKDNHSKSGTFKNVYLIKNPQKNKIINDQDLTLHG